MKKRVTRNYWGGWVRNISLLVSSRAHWIPKPSPATLSVMNEPLVVRILRADGPHEAGRYHTYRLEREPRSSVLDVLAAVQNSHDPTLAFRYSCRAGMCGTCSVRINGRNRWSCRTAIGDLGSGPLTVEPLPNYPVIKDLVVDMAPFFERYRRVRAEFVPAQPGRPDFASVRPDSAERQDIDRHVECITCGICYGSCGMAAASDSYLGPAALTRAFTLIRDSRDGAGEERLARTAGHEGVWGCHTQFNCSDECPMDLAPTSAIQKLKRLEVRHALSRIF